MSPDWQRELRDSYRSYAELERNGITVLKTEESQLLSSVEKRFSTRITKYYAALIDPELQAKGLCPIGAQAIASVEELDENQYWPAWATELSQCVFGSDTPWRVDPIGDRVCSPAARLTHRYHDRVLLHTSSHCAVECRFCFRKLQLNTNTPELYRDAFDNALAYLSGHPEIREVILTGGDPLSVSDSALAALLGKIDLISHIKTLRIHSRMPVTLPTRLTEALFEALSKWRFKVVLMCHFNHRKELTPEALAALRKARAFGIELRNQSVFLKRVNNTAPALTELFETLYENQIQPIYLHHPDLTQGTLHFRDSISHGKALLEEVRGKLGAHLPPLYVLDLPGGFGKVPLNDASCELKQSYLEDRFLGAQVYELKVPQHTLRAPSPATVLYADFWKRDRE